MGETDGFEDAAPAAGFLRGAEVAGGNCQGGAQLAEEIGRRLALMEQGGKLRGVAGIKVSGVVWSEDAEVSGDAGGDDGDAIGSGFREDGFAGIGGMGNDDGVAGGEALAEFFVGESAAPMIVAGVDHGAASFVGKRLIDGGAEVLEADTGGSGEKTGGAGGTEGVDG